MSAHRFQIVCGVDLSEHTSVVLTYLLDQAIRHDADVHVVTVVPDRGRLWHSPSDAEIDEAAGIARARLARFVQEAVEDVAPPPGSGKLWMHVRTGPPEEEILALAAEAYADLIIVGRSGGNAPGRRRFMGSVADRVLAAAECPVLVVQGASYAPGPASQEQCTDCVELRRSTRGEAWFCERHRAEGRAHAWTVMSLPERTGGQPMW